MPDAPAKVERTTEERAITDLSVSRVGLANKCGLAFEYQYVHRLPSPSESASSIFGSIIHGGVENWYGGEGPRTADNKDAHKEQSLVEIVKGEWPEQPPADDAVPEEYVQKRLPPKIWEMVSNLAQLEGERDALCSLIQVRRPTIKNPMQTKEFLESEAQQAFNTEMDALIKLSGEFKEIRWPKGENAYQAYCKSIQIAERIEAEWKDQPRPLLIEEPFRLEFEGYVLRGRIDQVRQDIDPATGQLVVPLLRDIKTGKQLMTQMEAFLQAFIYHEATRQMEYDFLPKAITEFDFYMARHVDAANRIKRQAGSIDRDRHAKLALKILHGVARRIITASFEPHYGMWCKSCDFRDLCETEISLWRGDGIAIGAI